MDSTKKTGICSVEITYELLTVEENAQYSEALLDPAVVVTYVAGENEDARVWTVFAMYAGRYTYIYGLGAAPDAAEEVKSAYPDIFAGLYLSDGE